MCWRVGVATAVRACFGRQCCGRRFARGELCSVALNGDRGTGVGLFEVRASVSVSWGRWVEILVFRGAGPVSCVGGCCVLCFPVSPVFFAGVSDSEFYLVARDVGSGTCWILACLLRGYGGVWERGGVGSVEREVSFGRVMREGGL